MHIFRQSENVSLCAYVRNVHSRKYALNIGEKVECTDFFFPFQEEKKCSTKYCHHTSCWAVAYRPLIIQTYKTNEEKKTEERKNERKTKT